MKILFAASECAPFAKAGGLGDVVGALPKALARLGHDVRVVLPKYGFIGVRDARRHLSPLAVPLGAGEAWCAVHENRLPGTDVPVYFLEHDALFGGRDIYDAHGGDLHDMARFALLSRGALQLCRYLDFTPDIVHVHDWPTAWVPLLLDTVEARPPFERTASVISIHNIAHQPRFPAEGLPMLGLPWSVYGPEGLEDYGELNPLKGGCWHATMLNAVSPTYAREICTPEGGAGLHEVMQARGADLVGILNGIDDEYWNPVTDPYLPAPFGPDDLSGKLICKRALQQELGLERRDEVPLLGVVSRMTLQKGTDVIASTLERILDLDTQMVVLGSGDPELEDFFRARALRRDGRFAAWIGYNESLAHRIEAASDLFLMPSRFEPCGLNQMYSQRYGTLPIVRSTGGLEDTVEQCDPDSGAGTGFKLWDLGEDSLVNTVAWALSVYRDRPYLFRAMQVRAMKKPMSWTTAAEGYVALYRAALDRVRSGLRMQLAR